MKWRKVALERKRNEGRIRRRKNLITGFVRSYKNLITGLTTAVLPLKVVATGSCYLLEFGFDQQ